MPGQMQLGLFGPYYGAGMCPFLNWYKQGVIDGNLKVTNNDTSTIVPPDLWSGGTLDPVTGDLASPVASTVNKLNRIFFVPPINDTGIMVAAGCSYAGEQFTVEYDGTGASVSILGQTKTTINSNKFTFTPPTNPANLQIVIDTWTNRSDPPRNFRIYQSRYAANVANGEVFNPDWISYVSQFGILRLMDWMGTNDSEQVDYANLATEAFFSWNANQPTSFMPLSGLPTSLIVKLAIATGCDIHVCIPHQATDAYVTSFVTAIRTGLSGYSNKIIYEYTNEHWNGTFDQAAYCATQGVAVFGGGDSARQYKWYGYRAAAIMKIIRDIYGTSERSKWRGVIATQTANTGVLDYVLVGINYWRANVLSPANSLAVNDLFDDIEVTGYYALAGTQVNARGISAATNAAPGVNRFTSTAHGWSTGQRVKFFSSAGMTQISDQYDTITVVDANTFTTDTIDTTAYGVYAASKTFAMDSKVFEVMDQSLTNFNADPIRYPTKYQYFNEQIATAILTGTSSSGLATTASTVFDAPVTGYWTVAKARAVTNGLQLRQYESGYSFAANIYQSDTTIVSNYPQFVNYMINAAYSEEVAAVGANLIKRFLQIGGFYPAQFLDAGLSSAYGAWGALRCFPTTVNPSGDTANPRWQSLVRCNAGLRRWKLTT
jgi:hypothetical protein